MIRGPDARRVADLFLAAIGGGIALYIALQVSPVESSHFTYRYPGAGWTGIAAGSYEGFAINPSLVGYNSAGADTRRAVRDAAAAWNNTRAWPAYIVEGGYPQVIKFDGIGGGTLISRKPIGGSCSTTNPLFGEHCFSWTWLGDNLAQGPLQGSLVHELGHALGSMTDHTDGSCYTVMSSCWFNLRAPTTADSLGMKRIVGIPDLPILAWLAGTTNTATSLARDNSLSDISNKFDLWRWNGSQWVYLHSHTGSNDTAAYRLTENVVAEAGCGYYLYGIWAYNSFVNGITGWQFAGFTQYLYFC